MKEFLKKFYPFLKNYKKHLIVSFIGVAIAAAGNAGVVYQIQPILDDVFIDKNSDLLFFVSFMLVLYYLMKSVGTYIQIVFMSYVGQSIVRELRDITLKNIMSLDLEFFNKNRSGELISRITNDITRIQNSVESLAVIIREALTVVALIGVTIYHSPKLAFIGLVVLPLSMYPLSILAKKMKKISFRSQEKISDLTSHLSEIFNNIEITKAYCAQKDELDKFKAHNNDFFKLNIKGVKVNALTSPLMEVLGSVAIAAVIIVGGLEVINGAMTTGEFFSFSGALFFLYTPLKRLSKLYNTIQDAVAASERIFGIIDLKPNIVSGKKEISKISKIEFVDARLSYDDKIALDGISYIATKNRSVALVGDSGAGKSSFVNTITRFYDLSGGDILIDGVSIKDIDIQSLRERIAVVSQRVYMFNDTVAQNVAYGHKMDKKRVVEALKLANAYEFVMELADGVDTILDEYGTNLSGGQRQRVSIARAIYKNPDIYILDEATSALDNESEKAIKESLAKISKDNIMFIIAHRLSAIKDVDEILVFKGGSIICQGDESHLLSKCKEYQRLIRV
jgi:subfamily B ATP-binding cassette protein MsbA